MKRFLPLLLLTVLLLISAGCRASQANDPTLSTPPTEKAPVPTETDATWETTAPTQTTAPPETTEVTEVTEPLETTPPTVNASSGDLYIDREMSDYLPSEEDLAKYQFEAWYGAPWLGGVYKFGYVGESGNITTPDGRLTIQLPQEWVEDLTIVWSSIDAWHWQVYVSSTELLRAVSASRDGIAPEDVDRADMIDHCYVEFSMEIYAINKASLRYDLELELLHESHCYLGKDEQYTYFVRTPESIERVHGRWVSREENIAKLGEDTYNDLLGGMIITEEMAKEMITITNPVED